MRNNPLRQIARLHRLMCVSNRSGGVARIGFILLAILITIADCPATYAQPASDFDQYGNNWSTPTGMPTYTPANANRTSGFRDYLNFLAGAAIGTQTGPTVYVGNYGGVEEPDTDDNTFTFVRLTDDIDEDGVIGQGFIVSPDGNIIQTFTDFDDLHTFNIAFDQITMERRGGFRSFDIGSVYWLYEEEVVDPDANASRAGNRE